MTKFIILIIFFVSTCIVDVSYISIFIIIDIGKSIFWFNACQLIFVIVTIDFICSITWWLYFVSKKIIAVFSYDCFSINRFCWSFQFIRFIVIIAVNDTIDCFWNNIVLSVILVFVFWQCLVTFSIDISCSTI